MKDKFKNRYRQFRMEMLKSRNKDNFKKKWLDTCQIEAYIYGEWLVENEVGLCKVLRQGYYDGMKDLMKKGYKFNRIKESMQDKLDKVIEEMSKIENFSYDDYPELCMDFTQAVYYLTRMKALPSSNTFGIIKTSKKPLEFVEIY